MSSYEQSTKDRIGVRMLLDAEADTSGNNTGPRSPRVVLELDGAHVVRVAPRFYVVVYVDTKAAEWTTSNAEGGAYFARGLGDAAFRDVCAYAARYGTRHRRLRDAVDVVRDEHAAQCEITCDHVLVSK